MRPVDPRLLRRARPVRTLLVALVALGVADAALLLAQAGLLAGLVSGLVPGGRSHGSAVPEAAALLAAGLGRGALGWLREALAARAGATAKGIVRLELLRRLIAGPIRAADRPRTGELATLATGGVDALDGYFARYLPQLVLACVVPIVVGTRILAADPVSALVIGLTVPLIPVFMVLIGLKTRDHMALRFRALERLGGHFLEVVAGLPTLVAFGRARGQKAAIRRAAEAHRRATVRTLRVAFLSSLALELIAMLSVALVAVGIGLRLADGSLDLRTGLVVLICAPEVYLPLRLVGARYHEAAEGLAVVDRVFGVGEEADGSQGSAISAPARTGGLTGFDGPIVVDGVVVARPGRGEPARPVSFTVPAGRVTGLVGPSGAGKSTLLNVLLGLDVPTGGTVTVGGVRLGECDLTAWRARIAWVSQQPRLTGATVADAIRLGRPDASEADLDRAAALAGVDFPLTTPLGRAGSALSGGQARRVALARAIVRDAPVVLLDEPTEHLDPETERVVTEALRRWLPGRTALVVTHRPALLDLCDEVVRIGAEVSATARPPRSVAAQISAGPHGDPLVAEAQPAGRPGTAAAAPDDTATRTGADRARADDPSAFAVPRLRRRMALAVLLGAAAAISAVGLAAASAWLITTAALRPPLLTLQVGIAAVQAFGFARATARYAERLVGHDATLRLLTGLRVRVYEGLLRVAPAGMSAERSGDLLAALTADVTAVQDLLLKVLLPASGAVLAAVALLVFDLCVLPAAAAVLLAALAVALVLAPAVTRLAARRAEGRTQSVRADLGTQVVDLLDALPDLIVHGAAEPAVADVAATDARLSALERRGALAAGCGSALISWAGAAAVVGLAVAARHATAAGAVSGPLAAAVVLGPLALFEVLAVVPDAARAWDRGRAGWARLRRIAAAEPVVPTPAAPVDAGWGPESVLEFDAVAAAWPGAQRPAVTDVSFRLRSGDHLVLTGPSGGGKSTIAQLAARGLDPVAGAVRVDGLDLRAMDPDRVRELIAVADQDAHLFDTTIGENLRIGRPGAAAPDLWRVLGLVHLDSWVAALPAGLDTPVGVLGDAVSGGERRRLALARALLCPAPVLVLDEPFAHLDADTAAAVERSLRRELADRTVLWIRHDDRAAGSGRPVVGVRGVAFREERVASPV